MQFKQATNGYIIFEKKLDRPTEYARRQVKLSNNNSPSSIYIASKSTGINTMSM